jgi:hypothetical protein
MCAILSKSLNTLKFEYSTTDIKAFNIQRKCCYSIHMQCLQEMFYEKNPRYEQTLAYFQTHIIYKKRRIYLFW